ncbi:adenosine deaminase [Stella humosa]|uniref:adenosine deaminase n=2 Tax=Stella humosa TaxID=94 RepID=A0A3N1MIQ4_9PROT|nr:adenosine deaminase [Stella humosa]
MRLVPIAFAALLSLAACAGNSQTPPAVDVAIADDETVTAALFEAIRDQPPLLQAYVRRLPKGADLHNHLSGTVYAENYLGQAARRGMCFDRARNSLVEPKPACDAARGRPPVAGADGALRAVMIDALSMRNFVPGDAAASGRDQFFATFPRFGSASEDWGPMLAEAVRRAADNGVLHMELMISPDRGRSRAVGRGLASAWTGDLAAFEAAVAPQLDPLLPAIRADLDRAEAEQRRILACDTPRAEPGCAVTVRYIAQVVRLFPPEQVFAQTAMAFRMAAADPRIVALNFVGAEDDGVALRDYRLHMRMIGHLRQRYPDVAVALHAGELVAGMVPPEDLRFHIREAIEVAGARRIGHGVSIMHEDDAIGLLELMARRDVLVEINPSSNAVILGVAGADHPLPIYRRFGVPVAISTDDEGVARSEITQEYIRAIRDFDLDYDDLKTISRDSLTYSFLPGASLWVGEDARTYVAACEGADPAAPPPAACAAFLAGSAKAAAQWRLEQAFDRFEDGVHDDVSRHPHLLQPAAGAAAR